MITSRTITPVLISSAALVCALATGCDDELADDAAEPRAAEDVADERDDDDPAGALCEEDPDGGLCGPGLDRPYRHPFQDVALVDGAIPLLDRKDSPAGRRYAAMDTYVDVAEDGRPARHVSSSGIVELERRPLDAEELARARVAREARAALRSEPAVVAPELARALAEAERRPGAAPLTVKINVVRPPGETLQQRVARRIARGEVYTVRDAQQAREDALAEIRDEVARTLAPVTAEIRALGGEVVYACEVGACMTARLSAAQARAIAARPDVQRMNVPGRMEEMGGFDGLHMRESYQYGQFWGAAFDGENVGDDDITFAIVEQGGYRFTHDAFLDGGPGTSDRIRGMYECGDASCVTKDGWYGDEQRDHATMALGSVLADATDGQVSLNADGAVRVSGPAREAQGYLYKVSDTPDAAMRAYNHLVQRPYAPALVSFSIGDTERDPSCTGEDDQSIDVDNLLYENGVLMFAAAGNSGGAVDDCRVISPGSAAGAFTVGGFGGTTTPSDDCAARAAGISASSSWGGSASVLAEGKGRTIVDLTGAYCQRFRTAAGSDTEFVDACGTSFATPSVAGAAITLIDAHKHLISDAIDDPGLLFAWMLNMGDRRGGSGDLSAQFDPRWGAGRIRMRMPNAAGMDTPYYVYSGWTCVDDGEVYTLPINGGNPLSADVDDMKVSIWWYDRRLENGTPIDDIDLAVRTTAGAYVRGSTDPADNKERVHVAPQGRALEVEIVGADVTSDVEGCGTDSMKVFYQVMIEDRDRDDVEGPHWDPVACQGVEPAL